jgi:hypothetical protein
VLTPHRAAQDVGIDPVQHRLDEALEDVLSFRGPRIEPDRLDVISMVKIELEPHHQ